MVDEVFGTINLNFNAPAFDKQGYPQLDPYMKTVIQEMGKLAKEIESAVKTFEKSSEQLQKDFAESKPNAKQVESIIQRGAELTTLIAAIKEFNKNIRKMGATQEGYEYLYSQSDPRNKNSIAYMIGRVRPTYTDAQVTRAGPYAPTEKERESRDVSNLSPTLNRMLQAPAGMETFMRSFRASNPNPELLKVVRDDFAQLIKNLLGESNYDAYQSEGKIEFAEGSWGDIAIKNASKFNRSAEEMRRDLVELIQGLHIGVRGRYVFLYSTQREGGFQPVDRFEEPLAAYVGKFAGRKGKDANVLKKMLDGLQEGVIDPLGEDGPRNAEEVQKLYQRAVGMFAQQRGTLGDSSFRAQASKMLADRLNDILQLIGEDALSILSQQVALKGQMPGEGRIVSNRLPILFKKDAFKELTGGEAMSDVPDPRAEIEALYKEFLEIQGDESQSDKADALLKRIGELEGIAAGGSFADANDAISRGLGDDNIIETLAHLLRYQPSTTGRGSKRGRRSKLDYAEEENTPISGKSVDEAVADRRAGREQASKLDPLVRELKKLEDASFDVPDAVESIKSLRRGLADALGAIKAGGRTEGQSLLDPTSHSKIGKIGSVRDILPLLGLEIPRASIGGDITASILNKTVLSKQRRRDDGSVETYMDVNDLLQGMRVRSTKSGGVGKPRVAADPVTLQFIDEKSGPYSKTFQPGDILSREEMLKLSREKSNLELVRTALQPLAMSEDQRRAAGAEVHRSLEAGELTYAPAASAAALKKTARIQNQFKPDDYYVPMMTSDRLQYSLLSKEFGIAPTNNLSAGIASAINDYGGDYRAFMRAHEKNMSPFARQAMEMLAPAIERSTREVDGGIYRVDPKGLDPVVKALIDAIQSRLAAGVMTEKDYQRVATGEAINQKALFDRKNIEKVGDEEYVSLRSGSGKEQIEGMFKLNDLVALIQSANKLGAEGGVRLQQLMDLDSGKIEALLQQRAKANLGSQITLERPTEPDVISLEPGGSIPDQPRPAAASTSQTGPQLPASDVARMRSAEQSMRGVADQYERAAEATDRMGRAHQSPLLQVQGVGSLVSEYAELSGILTSVVAGFEKLKQIVDTLGAKKLTGISNDLQAFGKVDLKRLDDIADRLYKIHTSGTLATQTIHKMQDVINAVNGDRIKTVAAEITAAFSDINGAINTKPTKSRGKAAATTQPAGQSSPVTLDIGPLKASLDLAARNMERQTDLLGKIFAGIEKLNAGLKINVTTTVKQSVADVTGDMQTAAQDAASGTTRRRRRRASGGGGAQPPQQPPAPPAPGGEEPDDERIIGLHAIDEMRAQQAERLREGLFIEGTGRRRQLYYRRVKTQKVDGKEVEVPDDRPIGWDYSLGPLETQERVGYRRRRTPAEIGAGVQMTQIADDLDMRLALALAETEMRQGKYLGRKVSIDTVFEEMTEKIRKDTELFGGRLVTDDVKTGKPIHRYDLKGMGFTPSEIEELSRRDYSAPRTMNLEQQEQFFYRFLSRLEQVIAQSVASGRMSVQGSGTGHSQREIWKQQEVLWNQRDPNTGLAMKTLAGTVDDQGRVMVKSLTAASESFGILERQARSALRRVMLWGGASFVIYGVVQQFQRMIVVTSELDDKMKKLQFLMNQTATDFDALSSSAFGVAKEFGKTIGETLDAMVVFAQQGRTQAEVIDLVRASLAASNQTELTATAATEALTAAMAIFNFTAQDSMRIIDAWANVANNNASTAIVLAEALKKVGATVQFVGVSFHEFNALVTTIAEATRKSGSEIGTSLKFIFQAIQRPETVKVLEEMGVAVFATADRMRPFIDIITDLRDRFKTLTDSQRLNALTTIASRRHYADLAVVLQNLDKVSEVTEDSQNSFGVAMRNNQIVMESFSKKMQQVRTTFAEVGTQVANAGLMEGIEGIANVGGKMISAFGKLPSLFSSTLVVVGALAYGMNALSRVVFGLGGENLPSLTKAYHAQAVAQKMMSDLNKEEIVTLLGKADAYERLSMMYAKYAAGTKAAQFIGDADMNRHIARAAFAEGYAIVGADYTPKNRKEQATISQMRGFANDQRKLYVQTYTTIGAFAAAAFMGSFSDTLRKNNEFGNMGREIGASIADGLQKGFIGLGVGSLFGKRGMVGGALVGLTVGLVTELAKYSDLTEIAIKRTNKFAEAINSQIGAIRQLQSEIDKLDFTKLDPLTGKLKFIEFPTTDPGVETFRRYADALSQLGKLESGPGFDARTAIEGILGETRGFDAGLPVSDLTSSLGELGTTTDGLTTAMDNLRDALEEIKKANTLQFFARLREQMEGIADEGDAYSKALQNPGSPIFGNLGGRVSVVSRRFAATVLDTVGLDTLASRQRAAADAGEEKSFITKALGAREGYDVNEIAKTAQFARQMNTFSEGLTDLVNELQTYRGFDSQSRMFATEWGINALVPGIAGMMREQLERAGYTPQEVTIGNMAEVIDALRRAPGDNTRAIALLSSLSQTFGAIYQRMATLNSGTIGASIQDQLRYNREQGFETSLTPALDEGRIDPNRLKDMIKPGLQGIFNTGDIFESAIVDSVSSDGLYEVVITKQKDKLIDGFAEIKKLTADEVADLFANLQNQYEQASLAQTGVDANRFFMSVVEDVQKGLRDISTTAQRLQTVFKKQMQAFNEELRAAKTAVEQTVPTMREELDLLVAQGNVSRQHSVRLLATSHSKSIRFRPVHSKCQRALRIRLPIQAESFMKLSRNPARLSAIRFAPQPSLLARLVI